MNRTPIASPLLLVGRDATETWHGSDDEYREVGISSANLTLARCAFIATNPEALLPHSHQRGYRAAWLEEGPSSFDGGSKIEIPGINDLVQKVDVRSHRPMASAHL